MGPRIEIKKLGWSITEGGGGEDDGDEDAAGKPKLKAEDTLIHL